VRTVAVRRPGQAAAHRPEWAPRRAGRWAPGPGFVLAAADGSPAGCAAVDHAAAEAALRGWELRIAHVQRAPGPRIAGRDAGATLLDGLVARVHARYRRLVVNGTLLVGPPARLLLAEARDAALVVVGHRHDGGGTRFGVSVGDRVAAQHRGPALVVRAISLIRCEETKATARPGVHHRIPGRVGPSPRPATGSGPIVLVADWRGPAADFVPAGTADWPGLAAGLVPAEVADRPRLDTPAAGFALAEARARGAGLLVLHAGPGADAGSRAASAGRTESVEGVRVRFESFARDPAAAVLDVADHAAALVLDRGRSAGGNAGLLRPVGRWALQRVICPLFLVG
jgi:nucleotide-binding universal stress UspA family protein